jgi:hypothetical protein
MPCKWAYSVVCHGEILDTSRVRDGYISGLADTRGHQRLLEALGDGVREKLDRNHRVEKFRRRGPNAGAPRTPGSRCAYTASSGADVGHPLGGAQELEEIRLRC